MIKDCGEAGHDEGRCGTTECLPSTQRAAETDRFIREMLELIAKAKKMQTALEHLIERCNTSDDMQYGTLSTTFVKDVAEEALK